MSISERHAIKVRVSDGLTMDAGWWEERQDCDTDSKRIVHPPQVTMFDQLLNYLSAIAEQVEGGAPTLEEEAIAATAVCIRWGSYVAVLADRDKPLMNNIDDECLSRISDSEMTRINVEASSALERWIELLRDHFQRYRTLVRAACSLPMIQLQATQSSEGDQLRMLTDPQFIAAISTRLDSDLGKVAERNAQAHPTRMAANSIIHVCWRNGPVEDIHAGKHAAYPLTRRRITAAEECSLVSASAGCLKHGLAAVHDLHTEKSGRIWSQKVLPCGMAPFLAPYRWSLDERTRMVELYGAEAPVYRAS
jgi:hypothetical protein